MLVVCCPPLCSRSSCPQRRTLHRRLRCTALQRTAGVSAEQVELRAESRRVDLNRARGCRQRCTASIFRASCESWVPGRQQTSFPTPANERALLSIHRQPPSIGQEWSAPHSPSRHSACVRESTLPSQCGAERRVPSSAAPTTGHEAELQQAQSTRTHQSSGPSERQPNRSATSGRKFVLDLQPLRESVSCHCRRTARRSGSVCTRNLTEGSLLADIGGRQQWASPGVHALHCSDLRNKHVLSQQTF